MTDYRVTLRAALEGARERGWKAIDGTTLRRITVHDTPGNIPAEWWPEPTYERLEFLSFVMRERGAPKVVHGVAAHPWTGRTDHTISFRKALAILKGESDD
ncbi:hypothetical protein ACFYMO_00725 [Streptomyces sp. NPDC007025]|uniref:hypothetical protein n=1 Tax=Streptomyces sp. NPDC007025 TaxID=3364771 RepID=UPI003690D247